jgi:tRNA threonylcarbamoyladenosine biosynthesis protein TsaB
MNLLALDTSTHQATLALIRADGSRFGAVSDATKRHGRTLLVDLEHLLRKADLSLAAVETIGVGLGPGSFTGLRIGVTAAKVLAYTTGCPVIGLDSLEILAWGAPPESLRISAAVDAQRGEVFHAEFHRSAPGAMPDRRGPTRIERRDHWLAGLSPETAVVGAFSGWQGPTGPNLPEPDHLAEVARRAVNRGRRDDLWTLEPLYLRRSAAEEREWRDDPDGPRTNRE